GQLRRRLLVEATEVEPWEVGAVEQRGLARACRDQDADRVGEQAAEGEQQGAGGRGVERLGVVDQEEQRLLLRVGRKKAQRGGADCEAVACPPGTQGERAAKRLGLRLRDLVDDGQRGAQKREAPAERHL